eukprot:TRINITY_DN5685_c0_g1_i1.p1 TRINITY_DN5685_c0_g1~~TRINITY_DN5685_c0_g1_i1.p1  ORF type:complete len:439 (+),score=123.72 TRINITY_DN5685_c0_g1_i1:140-1318(+)
MPPQSSYVAPRREENAQFQALAPGQAVTMRGYAPGPPTGRGQELIDRYESCMSRPAGNPPQGFPFPAGAGAQGPGPFGGRGAPPGQGYGGPFAGGHMGGGGDPGGLPPGYPMGGMGGGQPLWTPQQGYVQQQQQPHQQQQQQQSWNGPHMPPQSGYMPPRREENPEYMALQPGQSMVVQGYGNRTATDRGRALMDAYERAMSRPSGSFPNAYTGGGSRGKGSSQPGTNLRIANIPTTWGEIELRHCCESFGPVERLTVWLDPVTKESKGFGLVQFGSIEAARTCTARLAGQLLPGSVAPVQITVNSSSGKGGGGGKGGYKPSVPVAGGSLADRATEQKAGSPKGPGSPGAQPPAAAAGAEGAPAAASPRAAAVATSLPAGSPVGGSPRGAEQ